MREAGVCINIDKSHQYCGRFNARAAALTPSVSVFVFATQPHSSKDFVPIDFSEPQFLWRLMEGKHITNSVGFDPS